MISAAARAKLLVVAVFFIGGLTGALIDNAYETRWNVDPDSKRSQREVNQVYDFLDLTPEQRQQFQSILEASRPDSEKLFEENRKLVAPNNAKISELQELTRSRIRAILTEDQVKKYDGYNEQRRQRRRQPPPPRSK